MHKNGQRQDEKLNDGVILARGDFYLKENYCWHVCAIQNHPELLYRILQDRELTLLPVHGTVTILQHRVLPLPYHLEEFSDSS